MFVSGMDVGELGRLKFTLKGKASHSSIIEKKEGELSALELVY